MKEKINVIICGDMDGQHTTYVEHNRRYCQFYADEYEGIAAKEVIGFLKFLGYEVFEIHNNAFSVSEECIVSWR